MLETYYDIDSFRFYDVVRHWGRERLVHEVIVARELARGIVREGLRFQSVDPKWTKSSEVLRGYPLVGYSARHGLPPVLLRAEALEHLLAVEREAVDPNPVILWDEQVSRSDFRQWLVLTGRAMPKFWYGPQERHAEA